MALQVGQELPFAGYDWRVLGVADDRVLLLSVHVLALRWYHDRFVDTTWADCSLRAYLNGPFFDALPPAEAARVVPVQNPNPGNPWFGTPGGPVTEDRVFLLSLEEACTCFGDSTAALRAKGSRTWRIDDAHNEARRARFEGAFHSWRLRSPGYYARTSASISQDGSVYLRGNGVFGRPRDGGGVRPALWWRGPHGL